MHSTSTLSSSKNSPQKVAIAVQGGGALGAFCVGAAAALLDHIPLKVIAVTGTSSGAVTGHGFVRGWIEAIETNRPHEAQKSAKATMIHAWEELAKAQDHLTLWYPTRPLPVQAWRQAATAATQSLSGELPDAPLMAFYNDIEGGQKATPWRDGLPAFVANATIARKDAWTASVGDGRTASTNPRYTSPDIAPLTTLEREHRFVAASGALEFFKPVSVETHDGKTIKMQDGAYSSAIALPDTLVQDCLAQDATLIIIRTRPERADYPQAADAVRTDDWKRAHFNAKMDARLADLKERFPTLKILVIEPPGIELQRNPLISNEMRFDRESLQDRFQTGYAAGCEAIRKHFGVVPANFSPRELPFEDHHHKAMRDAHRLMTAPVVAATALMLGMATAAARSALWMRPDL